MGGGGNDGNSAHSAGIPRGWKQMLRDSGGDEKENAETKTHFTVTLLLMCMCPVARNNPSAIRLSKSPTS